MRLGEILDLIEDNAIYIAAFFLGFALYLSFCMLFPERALVIYLANAIALLMIIVSMYKR